MGLVRNDAPHCRCRQSGLKYSQSYPFFTKISTRNKTIPGQDIHVVPTIQQYKRSNKFIGARDKKRRGTKGIALVLRSSTTPPLTSTADDPLDAHRGLRFDYGIIRK